jgi:hypothetical protein
MSNQLSATNVRRLLFVAAAGVSMLGFIPRAGAAGPDMNAVNQPDSATATPSLPNGFVVKNEDAAAGVNTTLAQLTRRAVTKDSYDSFFSGFLSDLASRDKARAKEFKGADQKHLNELIGLLQTEWRAKYNQDFGLTDTDLAFYAQFPMVQGEVSDASSAANNWSAAPTADQAVMAGVNSAQQQCNAKALTNGRAVAIVRIPAGDGLPDINVSLLHQTLEGWYVDLPVDRSGEQIYNDLSSQLTFLTTHQDKWPGAVSEGYRMIARGVAASLYGVSRPGGTASAQ